ncbi:MAG TPA: ribosome biogenesis GTPase YqeH [Pseudogracilibacillus sp.]|nr:ribosome biogenesis GTPase YqeH [Pseudogracilibacillus sp.]
MTNNIICEGCGATLQTEDKNEIGFVPESAFAKGNELCQRCFQLRHYNKQLPISLDNDDFFTLISSISETDSLIIHLIDIFDVEGTLLKSLPRIVGNNPIVLVANKIDLLPKSTNKRKVLHWLARKAKEANIHPLATFLISATKSYQLDELAIEVERLRKNRDIYVVGVTNVGKSTFINQFINRSLGEKDVITTSYYPGTTLGFIHIPLNSNEALIDTPGIVNDEQMAHYVSASDLKTITPRNEIKPRNYQLIDKQTLFIGGLARIDFVKGEKQTFVCYFANEMPIHRTKLANADSLYERQIGKLLKPPNEKTLEKLPKLVKHSYRIRKPKTDIVFPGLGWMTILDGNVTVDVYSPKGIAVSLRDSLI